MSVEDTIRGMAETAKKAAGKVATLGTRSKDEALARIAEKLLKETSRIKEANQRDLEAGRQKGLSNAMPSHFLQNRKPFQLYLASHLPVPDATGRVFVAIGKIVDRTILVLVIFSLSWNILLLYEDSIPDLVNDIQFIPGPDLDSPELQVKPSQRKLFQKSHDIVRG